MNTFQRMSAYQDGRPGAMTARQRRRTVKKAGREPGAVIDRGGMGYPPSLRGYRILVGLADSAES